MYNLNEKMTTEKAQEILDMGFHCSQVVFAHCATRMGMDEAEALKLSSGLGGGCFHGEVCGTVSGGVMALSMAYGFNTEDNEAQNEKMVEKIHEFEDRFAEKNGTIVCRELLGYDMGKPEGPGNEEKDDTYKNCAGYCADACEILDDILKDK